LIEDTPASYEVRDSEVLLRTARVIDVRSDQVVLPDGAIATRDVVVHPGAVGIIALDQHPVDGYRVLLVQQYRHTVGQLLWEPPAGLLDEPGEDPLVAAQRELFEEAHHHAGRWDVLIDAFTSPGMTDEAIRIYLARDVRVADEPRYDAVDEERDMPVRWVPLADAVDGVLAGRLHNPMAVMGLLAAVRAQATGFATVRPANAPWPQMSPWPGSKRASGG
jgi:ADP-ribose pyrophosphatase